MAELREHFGAYFDAIPDVDAYVREQRGGGEAAQYDLRTLPERERADVAALRQTCDKLADALAYLTKRVDDLTSAAMTDLSRTSHDVAALRAELDGVSRIAVTAQTQGAAHERRMAALERTVEALTDAAARQADALQVLVLKQEDGK